MQVVRTIEEMRRASAALRKQGSLGLVPTMGALHEGHLSLVRAASTECASVVVSIFVNPKQFGPNEDFAKYPRTFESDCAALEKAGVAVVFAPSADEIYPERTPSMSVDPGELGARLDGMFRPGHFRGVATVVAKLFHIVQPDVAFFGQKDAAQVAVLRGMVRALNFSVRIVTCPTVRDDDGLAMSSRNRYLSADERAAALVIPETLRMTAEMVQCGVRSVEELKVAMLMKLAAAESVKLEYAEVVDPDLLLPLEDVRGGALVAVAAKVGSTRLIDNILLQPEGTA